MEKPVVYAQRLYVIPNALKRTSLVWNDNQTHTGEKLMKET